VKNLAVEILRYAQNDNITCLIATWYKPVAGKRRASRLSLVPKRELGYQPFMGLRSTHKLCKIYYGYKLSFDSFVKSLKFPPP